jgi:hypothetical protein
MACLVYSDNSGRQLVYRLDRERVSIGRSADGGSFAIRDGPASPEGGHRAGEQQLSLVEATVVLPMDGP